MRGKPGFLALQNIGFHAISAERDMDPQTISDSAKRGLATIRVLSIEHLEENVQAASLRLTDEEYQELTSVAESASS